MRLDAVTAVIRPRSDWEAVDLGFALARRDFWKCITLWWMAMAVPLAICSFLLWDHPIVVFFLFWWLAPIGSRLVLFQLSRRLFGEQPTWSKLLREIPKAWVRRFFYRMILARLSPWLPVTLAVEELEGLRGKAYKVRSNQIIRRGEGAMAWLCFISYVAVLWFGSSLFLVLMALIPEGQDGAWQQAMESWSPVLLSEMPLIIARSSAACLMLALSLTDLFVVAAGFGIYINNRTWIEGWDVDLVFRRLSQRLGKLVVLICLFGLLGQSAQGEPISTPAERIRDVKAQEEFVVHSVTDRDPEFKYSWDFSLPVEFLKFVVQAIGWSSVIAAVSLIGWAIWKNRHVFRNRGSGRDAPSIKQVARVVMGMQVSPDSLPENIPASAWALWVAGRHQEAMGLLYRGAISRVVEYGGVEIQESDTEGDCLERVRNTGVKAHPDYFKSLTAAWIRLAYAKTDTAESEVRALCDQWPFEDGRSR